MTRGAAITPLRLAGIGKRFGRLAVLRHIDLTVDAGEVVGLVGANGSGKTTLLSIIAGLLPASDGQRFLGDAEVPDIDQDHRARMAFVTHTTQLYPRLTAHENLALFEDLRRASGLSTRPAEPLLQRLSLTHAADRPVATYSRGMMQRLALARALAGTPELLLLDEPFTALDRPGRQQLADVLLEERARGLAVLLSSHDFEALVTVADRVVLLEGGRLVGEAARDGDDRDAFRERVLSLGLGETRAPADGPGQSDEAREASAHA